MKPGNPPCRLSQHKVNETHTLYDQTFSHTPTYHTLTGKLFSRPHRYGRPRPLNTNYSLPKPSKQFQKQQKTIIQFQHPSKPSASNNITIGVTTRIQSFLSLSKYLKHGASRLIPITSLSLITCIVTGQNIPRSEPIYFETKILFFPAIFSVKLTLKSTLKLITIKILFSKKTVDSSPLRRTE